eukprot:4044541-Karenia_brevis.AAC.1
MPRSMSQGVLQQKLVRRPWRGVPTEFTKRSSKRTRKEKGLWDCAAQDCSDRQESNGTIHLDARGGMLPLQQPVLPVAEAGLTT